MAEVILLLLFTNYAFAQWQRLSGGPSADYTQYIDMSLVKLTDDGKWRIWELMDYQTPKMSTTGEPILRLFPGVLSVLL